MSKQKNTIQDKKIPISTIIKQYGVRRALIFVALALFFASLIIVYNYLLTTYLKDSVKAKSESNAINSAKEVEIYLSTGTDTIEEAEYVVERMIDENASNEEILSYLTDETTNIQNSVLPASTGIYGCIRGEYFDGSGWVPDDDYDPKSRPWYTEAIDAGGELALINPYFDLYSEEVVTTIAKALPNGEDVVAIDITLGRIEEITRENISDENVLSMVISDNGFVIAHTDPKERGKNYLEEKGSNGSYIMKRMVDNGEESAEVNINGHDYIVYNVPIGNYWHAISVVDAKNMYKPINTMLITGLAAIAITFIIFTVIMIRSGKRTVVADNLSKVLSSSADIYMSLCDLDVINNSVAGVKNVNPAIAKAVEDCDNNMKELFMSIMKNLPESPTKQAAIEFTDLSTIDERMKDTNTDMVEYISYGNIWVRARFVVSERLPDGRVSHVLWMLENIDKEKKERDKLVDMSEKAVAASEAKSAFLSNMSHEIRTPINAILGMNEMVLRECKDDNIVTYSQNIRSSGNTLLGLVNDILDFSKIESGKMEIIPVEYDLASVLNDLVNMVRPRLEPKALELKLEIDEGIPSKLYGDDVRLRQVITNILTNAVKYTEKGSVTFGMTFCQDPDNEDNVILQVKIKDTGIGIKKEDMEKLFSEFERIEEKRNRNIEGTGLGMSITKSILGLMNSRLKVRSEYGEGSEFSFELVQGVIDRTPIGDYEKAYKNSIKEKEEYHGKFRAPKAHILVVDDTPMNILVFTSLLKMTEIKIDTAHSGDEGIAFAKMNKYDIIFLDHMMPNKDGIETLHELKASEDNLNPDIPYICLTANAISGAKDKYIAEGFNDYLTKPIDSEKLEEMIIRYLPDDKVTMINEKGSPAADESDDEGDDHIPEFIFTVIDLNAMDGIKKCGSEKIYIKALAAFVESIQPTITRTEEYLDNNDMEDVIINIHSIKTAAAMIGAEYISNVARQIEEAGPDNFDIGKMNDLFDRCIEMSVHLAPLL